MSDAHNFLPGHSVLPQTLQENLGTEGLTVLNDDICKGFYRKPYSLQRNEKKQVLYGFGLGVRITLLCCGRS